MKRQKYKSGIVRIDGRWLAYCVDHGVFQFAPSFIKSWIVLIWNNIACLKGHGYLVQDHPDHLPECTMCCRKVRHPQTEPIQTWEKEETSEHR